MKKFFFLAAGALVGLAASAQSVIRYTQGAQVATLDDLTTGRYVISAVAKNQCAMLKQTTGTTGNEGGDSKSFAAFFSSAMDFTTARADSSAVWDIVVTEQDGTKTFTVKNVATGRYILNKGKDKNDRGNIYATEDASLAANFQLKAITEEISVSHQTDSVYWAWISPTHSYATSDREVFVHCNIDAGQGRTPHIAFWDGASDFGTGSATALAMFKAVETEVPTYSITVNFPDCGNYSVSIDGVLEGATASEVLTGVPSYYNVSEVKAADNTTVVDATHTTFTATGSWALPFEFGKVYRMKNKNLQYAFVNTTGDVVRAVNNNSTNADLLVPERLWYFKDAGFSNGVKLATVHSLAIGDAQGLVVIDANGDNDNNVTFSATPTTFRIVTNSTNVNGFSLGHPTSDNCYLNARGNNISTWNGNIGHKGDARNDGGSALVVYSLADSDFPGDLVPATDPEIKTLGDATALAAKVEAAKTSHSPADVKAFIEAVAPLDVNTGWLTNGGLFRISFNRSQFVGFADGSANADGSIPQDNNNTARPVHKHARGTNVTADELWYFEPVEGEANTVYIRSANSSGYYMGTPDGGTTNLTVYKEYAGKFTMTRVARTIAGGRWIAQINGGENYMHDHGSNQTNAFGAWTGGASDAGNIVVIEQVDSIRYAFPDGTHGSVCYPFAVEIPEGVTASYADKSMTDAKGTVYLHLVEITGGVIPANTPVILEGSGTAAFKIVTEAAQSDIADNILTGVTLKRSGFAAGAHYALAHNATSFFAKNSEANATTAANSAILETSKLTDAAHADDQILLSKEDFTGICEIGVDGTSAPAVLYDLQGRRVARPVSGRIYITSKGEKMLVK